MLIHILTKYSVCYSFFTDYVDEIFQTFMKASKEDLKDAASNMQEKTPAPMNTMLEKQPREEALQKRAERSKMVTKDVPPTTPGNKKLDNSTKFYNFCPIHCVKA